MKPIDLSPDWIQFHDPFKTCMVSLPVNTIIEIHDNTRDTDSSPTTLIITRNGNTHYIPNTYAEVMRHIRPALGHLINIPAADQTPARRTKPIIVRDWNGNPIGKAANGEEAWNVLAAHLDARNQEKAA